MKKDDFISASIVTFNGCNKAAELCKSLLKFTKKYPLKLYVIDNNSNDGSVESLEQISDIKLVLNKNNVGFGAAHNQALSYDIGKYHFIINPDIIVENDILSDMTDFFEQNQDILMAMPKILNEDYTEQKLPKEKPSFRYLFLGRLENIGKPFKKIRQQYIWENKKTDNVTDIDFCSGCFFGIKGSVFKNLNGFDERFFMYLEDADLTLRAKKSGRVVIAPQFYVLHLWERASAKKIRFLLIHTKSALKFLFKWREKK